MIVGAPRSNSSDSLLLHEEEEELRKRHKINLMILLLLIFLYLGKHSEEFVMYSKRHFSLGRARIEVCPFALPLKAWDQRHVLLLNHIVLETRSRLS